MSDMGAKPESLYGKRGPTSLAELSCWPSTVLQSLLCAGDGSDGERMNRLRALLQPGLQMYSDYSGLAGEHELMCQMRFALGKFAEEHSGAAADFRHVSILHSRFCDCGKVQQRVLNHISEQHERHICVLADINDRLPKEAQSMLDALLPQGVTPSAEIAEAYGNMLKWLQENRSWVFPVQPTSHCIVHGQQCPVFPEERALSGTVEAGVAPVRRVRRKLFQSSDSDGGTLKQKLRINIAGTTCCGWSAVGKRLQLADPSERPHAIWATERLRRAELNLEDLFFSECTPRYPVQMGRSVQQHATHHVLLMLSNTGSLYPDTAKPFQSEFQNL